MAETFMHCHQQIIVEYQEVCILAYFDRAFLVSMPSCLERIRRVIDLLVLRQETELH